MPNIVSVAPASLSPDGRTASIRRSPAPPPAGTATNLAQTLRPRAAPTAAAGHWRDVLIGGTTAVGIDFADALSSKLLLFVAILVGARRRAAIGDVLAANPAQGGDHELALDGSRALGHGRDLPARLGGRPDRHQPWSDRAMLLLILFTIVFGLSMDYEVFLISRIHERWRQTGDFSQSVVDALDSSARGIAAAASIMICVFLSFVFGSDRVFNLFGLILPSAVFLDVFVIGSLLLPAVLELLGRRTWQPPRWPSRRLWTVQLHPPREPTPALETS